MVQIVLVGPQESMMYKRGDSGIITFEKGKPKEVVEEFAKELIGKSLIEDGKHMTVEQAAAYGVPVFEEVGSTAPPREEEPEPR